MQVEKAEVLYRWKAGWSTMQVEKAEVLYSWKAGWSTTMQVEKAEVFYRWKAGKHCRWKGGSIIQVEGWLEYNADGKG
jgi:hypothetical protein